MKGQEVTQEQIEAWKKKHKNVFRLTIEDKVAYLRAPDRQVLSFASAAATKDPLKFNEAILKNCWLGGDTEIRDDDAYFLAASSKIAELIEVKEAEMEKL